MLRLTTIVLLLLPLTLSAQIDYDWVFGKGCHITFNTPDNEPIFVDLLNGYAGWNNSVVSNKEGKLAFYSMSNEVYNAKGEVIYMKSNANRNRNMLLFKISENHYGFVNPIWFWGDQTGSLSSINIYLTKKDTIISKETIFESNVWTWDGGGGE